MENIGEEQQGIRDDEKRRFNLQYGFFVKSYFKFDLFTFPECI